VFVTRCKLSAGLAAVLLVGAGTLSVFGAAEPAAAQMMGEGYKFLQAIRERDGEAVTKATDPSKGGTIINTQDYSTGDTGLHIVTQRRDLDWLSFLLARGADTNKANNAGAHPLDLAVGLGWVEGAQLLLQQGARADTPGAGGETPLILAVHRKDLAMVRLLIRFGANPNRADVSGRTARDYAALLGPDSLIASEVAAASKAAAARKAQTYGPSF